MGLFLRCFDEMTVIMIVIVPLYPLGGGLLRCESPQMKKGNVVTHFGVERKVAAEETVTFLSLACHLSRRERVRHFKKPESGANYD